MILVARDGVEPPTPAFSGLRSTGLTTPSINNLTRQDGRFIVTILFCDQRRCSPKRRQYTSRDCCHNLRRAWILKRKSCHCRESTMSDRKLLKLRNTDGYQKRFQ